VTGNINRTGTRTRRDQRVSNHGFFALSAHWSMLVTRGIFFNFGIRGIEHQGGCVDRVSQQRGPCVLVIDDQEISRRHTVQALRQCACRVKTAGNARQGLERSLRYRPGLILLDLSLPDMDGLSLAQRILEMWPKTDCAPALVILSGTPRPSSDRRLSGRIITNWVQKPASHEEIQHLARFHLKLNEGVGEASVSGRIPTSRRHMKQLFLADLERLFPELDHHISRLEWKLARRVLHQLIAASAICREREIEFHFRLLQECLAQPLRTAELAQAWSGTLHAIARAQLADQTW